MDKKTFIIFAVVVALFFLALFLSFFSAEIMVRLGMQNLNYPVS